MQLDPKRHLRTAAIADPHRGPLGDAATLPNWNPKGRPSEKVDLNPLRHFQLKSRWGTKTPKHGVLTFSDGRVTSKTDMKTALRGM